MKYTILIAALFSLFVSSATFAQDSTNSTEESAGERGEHSDSHGHKHGHRFRKSLAKKAERMFSKVDTNEDGALDLNEFLQNAEQRFQKMDLNGDGSVTPEEAKEAHQVMREEYRAAKRAKREARSDSE